MNTSLRVLIVEDSEDDSLLLVRELRNGGFDPAFERVETEEAMTAALAEKPWDIVIADYVLPKFSGLNALKLLQKTGLDLPFILVSGTIGEETAVESMKAGAHDYIMKSNLSRLIPAVERELREAAVRRDHRIIEEKLKESENLYRTIFETTGTSTVILEEDAIISLVNNEGERLLGYSKDELEGKRRWVEFVVKDELDRLKEYHRLRRVDPDAVPRNYETRLYDKQGNIKHVMVTAAMIPGTTRSIVSLIDITEGKKMEKELKKRVKELEEFYGIAIGRELKMKDLKEEIERLRRALEKCQKS